MQTIKIKKKFTCWWRTYVVTDEPKIVIGEMALSRPTVALKLASGDYLYIGAECIKEMKFFADKEPRETDNGLPDVRRSEAEQE